MTGLRNQTILVLRGEEDQLAAAELIRQRGGTPVACPMIVIAPPDDHSGLDRAIAEIDRFDWIVMTSAHAVRFFMDRFRLSRSGSPVAARVAVIGPATEEAARDAGLEPSFIAGKATAEECLRRFAEAYAIDGVRFFLPLSDIARRTLPGGLRELGGEVTEAVAYCNHPAESVTPEAREALCAGAPPWALFTSPSTVYAFLDCLEREETSYAFHAASIGPSTSAALRERGLEPAAEADPHTLPGLLDAIERGVTR